MIYLDYSATTPISFDVLDSYDKVKNLLEIQILYIV